MSEENKGMRKESEEKNKMFLFLLILQSMAAVRYITFIR